MHTLAAKVEITGTNIRLIVSTTLGTKEIFGVPFDCMSEITSRMLVDWCLKLALMETNNKQSELETLRLIIEQGDDCDDK